MKILIPIIPHSNRHDDTVKGFSNASFPLGIAYVIAAIRKKFPEAEINVAQFDLMQIYTEKEINKELGGIKEKFSPDYILFGGMITRYHYLIMLSKNAKKIFPQAIQILGGSAATWGYHLFDNEAPIDFMVLGEAEDLIISILTKNYNNIPGILQLDLNGNYQGIPTKQVIKNLDEIPFPSYSDFNIPEYLAIQKRNTGWKTLPIVASRGCPFLCHFCTPSSDSLRMRSVDNVIEEMKFLKETYEVDSIYFWDELQFVNKKWFEEFCTKLIVEKLNLKWVIVTRASLMKEKHIPLLKLARKAGCCRLAVGIESGSEKILKSMNKGTTPKQMSDALRISRLAGIKATGSMLLGMPGENIETIQASIDFANENLLETSFYNLVALPGSEVYDSYCMRNNLIPNEKEYINKVSLAGGDASNIIINLTELDDATYIQETARANALVKNYTIYDVIRYYGFYNGVLHNLKLIYLKINRKLSSRMFDTP